MIRYPKALEDLIESFQSLPSVGRKTAERYALFILNHMEEENINDFSNSLLSLKKDIHSCIICGNMTEGSICPICMDKQRNTKQIIIVEDVKDLYTLENLSIFKGVYHVLNGYINPSKGIGFDDINLSSLIKRIEQDNVSEIIPDEYLMVEIFRTELDERIIRFTPKGLRYEKIVGGLDE